MREQLNKEGYILIKNFFDKKVLNDIYTEARMLFSEQIERVLGQKIDINDKDNFEDAMFRLFNEDFETFKNTGLQTQYLISLHKLGVDDTIVDLLKSLGLSYPSLAVKPSMQFNSRFLSKNNTYWKLGAHQDWRTGQGSLDSLVLWFPMIDAGTDLGALQVIPGSHLWGLMSAETSGYEGFIENGIKDEDFVQCEFEAGDLLIFSAFLVHRSGENITKNIRWSVQYRYNNLTEPSFINRGVPMPYTYKPSSELVTPNFPDQHLLKDIFAS